MVLHTYCQKQPTQVFRHTAVQNISEIIIITIIIIIIIITIIIIIIIIIIIVISLLLLTFIQVPFINTMIFLLINLKIHEDNES